MAVDRIKDLSTPVNITDLDDVTAKTGSGTTVVMNDTPTILTPTVADLSNMTHDHSDASNGGTFTVNVVRLNVYNNSGSAITVGQVVYVSGWNAGTSEPTIDLADADNASAMPAVGMADTTINNLSSGTVIQFGIVTGINTAGLGSGDPLYVDTTPGAYVNARPTVDDIQKIGVVLQVAAGGSALIVGAGRSNDVPIAPSFTDFTNANHDHSNAAGGGTLPVGSIPDGGDATAIHDNVASEISAITVKGSPAAGDFLIIEDSAAGNVKKHVTIGSLPAGGEVNDLAADGIQNIIDDQLAVGTGAGTAAYLTLSTAGVVSFNGTAFSQGALAGLSDVTGTTGTGSTLVFDTSPTIVTPTIASFANAAHDHVDAAGGGQLDHTTALTNIGSNSHTAIDNHISGTTEHGATGAVMGTTNTQTVSGKDLTNQTNKLHWSKGITLESPADGERFAIYMNERAVTITGISFSGEGGTSVLFNIEYATTVASGTVIHTDTATISTPEWDVTPSGTTAVPTNQIILLEITTVTGTVNQLHVTIEGDHT